MKRLSVRYVLASAVTLFCIFATLRPPRLEAQTVTGDDIAAVMVGEDDVPGFHLAGDGSPPPDLGAANTQRTRVFFSNDSTATDYTLLSVIVTVANENAICLSYLPEYVTGGEVLGRLNDDKPNFERLDPLGVGEVETVARWSDLDAGANRWLSVFSAVFMRGHVTVYLIYRTERDSVDPAQIASYARAQDERLLQAATAGSPVGIEVRTPVPAPPADRPEICS